MLSENNFNCRPIICFGVGVTPHTHITKRRVKMHDQLVLAFVECVLIH